MYGAFRDNPPPIIYKYWDYGLSYLVGGFNKALDLLHYTPSDWVIYSLPQGLWVFSHTLIVGTIWCNGTKIQKGLWYGTAFLFAVGWEWLQYLNLINGTFCWVDLFLGLLGMFFGFSILKINKK